MKNNTLVQFSSLTELAAFVKTIHSSAYIINTTRLTVRALLDAFEIALAVEQFGGTVAQQNELV